jgi:hypothetical protein
MIFDGYFERLPGGSMEIVEYCDGSADIRIDVDAGHRVQASGDSPITLTVDSVYLPRALLRIRRILERPHGSLWDMAWLAAHARGTP